MKSAKIRFIEVFSDGTINFVHASEKTVKQTTFYEKDALLLVYAQKIVTIQTSPNTSPVFLKSRYKL